MKHKSWVSLDFEISLYISTHTHTHKDRKRKKGKKKNKTNNQAKPNQTQTKQNKNMLLWVSNHLLYLTGCTWNNYNINILISINVFNLEVENINTPIWLKLIRLVDT